MVETMAVNDFHCTPHIAGVSAKSCTSSCLGTCHGVGRVWVIAACGGHLALYEKWHHARAELIPLGQDIVPDSLEALVALLKKSYTEKKFEQLLLVGKQNDLNWVQLLLPEEVANCIVAEIRYPLLEAWFAETPRMQSLNNTLRELLRG